MSHRLLWLLALPLLLAACADPSAPATKADRGEAPAGETLFTSLPARYTGIGFENALTSSEALNIFTYRNYYNGGGVAIGDLDGDGRPDLYLTANMGPNRLYLNRGDLWFEDVTEAAGVAGERAWSTGVSVADVNGDGRLDLYVCNAGNAEDDDKANELYINQGPGPDGVPRFEEQAAAYGLADEGYSTHAAFFDYDRDGDLDLYLLNNSFRDVSSFGLRNIRHVRDDLGGDKLYRNDASGPPGTVSTFTDVSREAGIYGSEIGFGLGVTVGDVDRDGWPDVYVSNDFFERDYLYLNNGDGTFREALTEQMPIVSLASMGADMADVTGDGYPEIYVTDMLPPTQERLKRTSTFESWDVYQAKLKNDYHHQFMRNMLHLNNRNGTFSEVGQIAGVEATDWSWGALFADFDLDGRRDLFVANGIYKDLTDQDFINFFANDIRTTAQGGQEIDPERKYGRLLERIPSTPIPNHAFRNDGPSASGSGVAFTDVTDAWGFEAPTFSNGAAYGDLDGDGDLDLVVNNVNQQALVYRNEAASRSGHHALRVRLEGEGRNRFGIGAGVTAYVDGRRLYHEQMPMRGFQSTMEEVITLGLGPAARVDSLTVAWPDGTTQTIEDVDAGQTVTLRQADARPAPGTPDDAPPARRFREVTADVDLPYAHEENDFVDFDREPLTVRMLSTEGPALAVGDADGDGRDDLYLGGAKGQPGRLLLQRPDGTFRPAPGSTALFEADRVAEDTDAAFFDADGDGALDLYVASGGSEFSGRAPALADRLYLGDGRGGFREASALLPTRYESTGTVTPGDYDGDGDTDLFVGSRVVPWSYGLPPESALLANDGRGRFTDVTEAAAPGLRRAGMVTDAAWADADGDGRVDLWVAGEWMPLTLFRNTGTGLQRAETPGLEHTGGWWNRLLTHDFDGDGDLDLVAGNLGRNAALTADSLRPTTLYAGDFDRNGTTDQVLTVPTGDDATTPFLMRNELAYGISYIRRLFPSHEAYARATTEDVLNEEQRTQAHVLHARTASTSYVENRGDGTFAVRPLPWAAQLAPVYGLLAGDFDGDGHDDLLTAGNFHAAKPQIGRLAASYGLYLRGDGTGHFEAVPADTSGFVLPGETRALRFVDTPRGRLVLAAKNDGPPQLFAVE